jgi:hypothetical protein
MLTHRNGQSWLRSLWFTCEQVFNFLGFCTAWSSSATHDRRLFLFLSGSWRAARVGSRFRPSVVGGCLVFRLQLRTAHSRAKHCVKLMFSSERRLH